ncbi:MAG: peptidylprolyl isomerase [Rhizobiaceae bacterium]
MKSIKLVLVATLVACIATLSHAADKANTLLLDTKTGQIVIELLPKKAPGHVKQIRTLANQGFYDGLNFHRVIDGFMAQTGDPLGNGTGGSDLPDLKAEFNDVPFIRGTVGMARSQNPDSGNSQFFIMFASAPHLDGGYTVFGQVIKGMEHVDAIKRGRGGNGMVSNPDKIVKMRTADKY